eukprot:8689612-Alexandrium_andersonii.AAC.1
MTVPLSVPVSVPVSVGCTALRALQACLLLALAMVPGLMCTRASHAPVPSGCSSVRLSVCRGVGAV